MPEHLYITLSLYPMTMWVGHWVTNGDEEDGDATDNNNDTTILFTTSVSEISSSQTSFQFTSDK